MKTSKSFLAILLFPFFALLIMVSCSDKEPVVEPVFTCYSEALFSRECAIGTMLFLSCYDSWSIKLDEKNADGDHLIAASLDIPESYKVNDLKAKIDACFCDFDLTLLFPDPVIWGEMYVIKDYNISTRL